MHFLKKRGLSYKACGGFHTGVEVRGGLAVDYGWRFVLDGGDGLALT